MAYKMLLNYSAERNENIDKVDDPVKRGIEKENSKFTNSNANGEFVRMYNIIRGSAKKKNRECIQFIVNVEIWEKNDVKLE